MSGGLCYRRRRRNVPLPPSEGNAKMLKIPKLARLMKLVAMLRKNAYPNHRKLQRALDAARPWSEVNAYSLSQKTVQRDVQYLRDAYHAPIVFDNGKRGYRLTDPEWRFEVPELDADEMRAVTLGSRLAETILPEPVASRVRDAAEYLLCRNRTGLDAGLRLDALVARGPRIPVEPAVFDPVFTAWQNRRGVLATCRDERGKTAKLVIEPHVLAFCGDLWYVRAVVVSENGVMLPERTIRTLALHRFVAAEPYRASFAPDARLIAQANEGRLFDLPTLDEAVLRFTGDAIWYARENCDPALIEEEPDGSLLVTFYDAGESELVDLVLSKGGAVRVVSPPALAEEVVEQAKRVLDAQTGFSGTT